MIASSKLQFCYSIFAVILIFLSLHVSTKSDDSKLRNKALKSLIISGDKSLCENNKVECVKSNRQIESRYMVNSNLKMAFCSLNKDFSNMVFESTCYLQKPEFFLKNKHLLNSKKGSSQICSNIKYSYKNISEIAEVFDKNHNFYNDFKLNAFVRDPVERLIDTYIEQCVSSKSPKAKKTTCNGCGRDLKCVVEGLYKKLIKFSNGKIKETSLTVIDQQLSLQSWSCEFKQYRKYYNIIKYTRKLVAKNNYVDKYLSILRSRNATQDQILYIKKQYSKDVSLGSTLSQQLRSNLYNMLKIDPRMRFLLYKIYYYDYFEMNIDMPVWLKEVEVSKGTPKPYVQKTKFANKFGTKDKVFKRKSITKKKLILAKVGVPKKEDILTQLIQIQNQSTKETQPRHTIDLVRQHSLNNSKTSGSDHKDMYKPSNPLPAKKPKDKKENNVTLKNSIEFQKLKNRIKDLELKLSQVKKKEHKPKVNKASRRKLPSKIPSFNDMLFEPFKGLINSLNPPKNNLT